MPYSQPENVSDGLGKTLLTLFIKEKLRKEF